MAIILAKNIIKNYYHQGNISVLKNVNLSVKQGISLAIKGESGRGKTTLLYLLSGLDRPTSGQIFIQNQRIDNLSEKELSRFRANTFGFIFQHHFLLNDLSALENALLPLRITNKLSPQKIQQTKDYFEYLGIAHRLTHEPKRLSGGECQKVAVIRALVHEPLIVFADEPTGSLDQQSAIQLEQLLFDLVEEKKMTLVISTHNQHIAKHCQISVTIDSLEKNDANH